MRGADGAVAVSVSGAAVVTGVDSSSPSAGITMSCGGSLANTSPDKISP
jgi:hypothetical protein